MRRPERLALGLLMAAALAATPAASGAPVIETDGQPGYKTLADLAVMDRGRVKPLHTVAIERVKLIHARQTIKFQNAKGETTEEWGPVAAVLDWSVRPEFWNEQEFILVEYLPLKRMLLAAPVRERLETIATRDGTPAETRKALESLAKSDEYNEADVARVLGLKGLTDEDREALETLAHKLSADTKWLAPSDLEDAVVNVHDGHQDTFLDWFARDPRQAAERRRRHDGGRRHAALGPGKEGR